MTPPTRPILLTATVAALALSGCETGPAATEDAAGAGLAAAPQTSGTAVRDVERPDVFSTSETALWDGRPSLGGVWVAHPDVSAPERVRIARKDGTSIEGALFRRERDNPGPRIQVSSEAAKALGIVAGTPTELTLVAIREETIEVEAPDGGTPEIALPAGADAPVTDIAAAAIAEAEGSPGQAADLADNAAVTELEPAEFRRPRRGFFDRLRDGFRPRPSTAPAADVAIAADATLDGTPALPVPQVETAPLADAARPVAADPAAGAERPGNAYVQVGLFADRENAEAVAARLRREGIVPNVIEGSGANGPFWRVTVGPMATAGERSTILEAVRRLGYADAYLTAN